MSKKGDSALLRINREVFVFEALGDAFDVFARHFEGSEKSHSRSERHAK